MTTTFTKLGISAISATLCGCATGNLDALPTSKISSNRPVNELSECVRRVLEPRFGKNLRIETLGFRDELRFSPINRLTAFIGIEGSAVSAAWTITVRPVKFGSEAEIWAEPQDAARFKDIFSHCI